MKLAIDQIRLKNDITKLWALIGVSVVMVYILPSLYSFVFFAALILIIINSKRYDYFWIAFWFVIFDCPGHFFDSGGVHLKQLPFITFAGGVIGSFLQK
jgi:hypothetical protein